MFKKYQDFYRNGLKLANDNIYLYGIGLVLILLAQYFELSRLFKFSLPALGVVSIVAFVVYFGYAVSYSVFLTDILDGKKLSLEKIAKTSLETAKRLILPGLVIVGGLIVFLLVLIIIFAIIFGQQLSHFLATSGYLQILFLGIILLGLRFQTFSIHFALEHKRFIAALKESWAYTGKHTELMLLVLPYLLSLWVISTVQITFFKTNTVIPLFVTLVTTYLTLVMHGATLLYYRKAAK